MIFLCHRRTNDKDPKGTMIQNPATTKNGDSGHALFLPMHMSAAGLVSVGSRRGDVSDRPLRRHKTLASQATDQGVEDRGEEYSEERHTEHAEEHHRAESLSHFGAGAGGDDQRDHADDER